MDGTTQSRGGRVVDPAAVPRGRAGAAETSLCQAVLDGDLPPVLPDLTAFPAAMALPPLVCPVLRSFVTVPVLLSDGSLYGTVWRGRLTSDPELTERDRPSWRMLAAAAATLVRAGVCASAPVPKEVELRLAPVVAAGRGRRAAPADRRPRHRCARGCEALSRFPREWAKAPDVCFAEAHSVGLGHRLELLALERAAEHLAVVQGYVAMNVSPATLLRPECTALLERLPLDRVLLELSEHDQVEDYAALAAVLGPLRTAGLRLAVDDVGAGFSSLRHIVRTSPDVLKLDRSIVDGLAADPVLRTLVRALVEFAHGCGATVVAEGVETAADAAALLALEVDLGQGWHFGRPGPAAALDGAAVPPEPLPVVRPAAARTGRAPSRWAPWSGHEDVDGLGRRPAPILGCDLSPGARAAHGDDRAHRGPGTAARAAARGRRARVGHPR
jgi:EAL domain-containing protein (putative c-di-GMP-specific phosphodiesterase class I)